MGSCLSFSQNCLTSSFLNLAALAHSPALLSLLPPILQGLATHKQFCIPGQQLSPDHICHHLRGRMVTKQGENSSDALL